MKPLEISLYKKVLKEFHQFCTVHKINSTQLLQVNGTKGVEDDQATVPPSNISKNSLKSKLPSYDETPDLLKKAVDKWSYKPNKSPGNNLKEDLKTPAQEKITTHKSASNPLPRISGNDIQKVIRNKLYAKYETHVSTKRTFKRSFLNRLLFDMKLLFSQR